MLATTKKRGGNHTATCLRLQFFCRNMYSTNKKIKRIALICWYRSIHKTTISDLQIFWSSLLSLFGASFLALQRHEEWRLHLHLWLSIHQPSCYFIVVYDTTSGVLFSNNCFIYCQEDQHRFTDYCSYISWPLSYHCWRTLNIPPTKMLLATPRQLEIM